MYLKQKIGKILVLKGEKMVTTSLKRRDKRSWTKLVAVT